ncbi:MAG TPA: trypsin-like peptidase domain-containing protein [Gemmatimonadales bacterium]|nr:trypsin-like peptidase domain-containing protein [Gemmatimonadales bacterium]
MPAASGGPLAALSNDLAAAVETVGRSVVAIHARRRIPASGIVWQPGLVVAAHHTIQRDEEIGVTLHDGSTVPATLAGRDPSTDLAVLRLPPEISATAAPPASFATEAPRVGQLALVLGRPGPAITAGLGIVSAVGGEWRTWQGGTIDHFVRLDVAVHDGFSGGPLVDAGGKVVGVNTSGLARAAALTVPAATVARVAGQLAASGHIARGWLGIATQPVRLPATLRRGLGLESEAGLVVVNVEPESPADRGGVLIGDIVVAVADRAVSDPADVLAALGGERIGQPIVLRVARGGKDERVTVTVGERPRGRR